jgi:hypothetical protein
VKLFLKGKGKEIALSPRDLVGQGGQGSVFAKGKTAFKVYHDPKDMIPVGKIQELSIITDPWIVRPLDILVNARGTPVGYTTTFVPNAWTLCQLFPPVFRQRENLTPDMTQALVRKLQERIANVHKVGILVVDANEMNFLVDKQFQNVFAIDVDSYETPHYPASAIMESIRDWTVKRWSDLSDWYSFGILAFQMFVGIHPFKGRYHGRKVEFKNKQATDTDDDAFAVTRRRMQQNISVFHPDVGVPGVALPLDTIPTAYRRWFEALFVHGKRCAPPAEFGIVVVPVAVAKIASGTDLLDIVELGVVEGTVAQVWSDGTHLVVASAKGIWLDGVPTGVKAMQCAFTPTARRVVVISDGKLYNVTDRQEIGPLPLTAEEATSYDGRIYLRTTDRVCEVVLSDAGSQVIVSTCEVAQTLPHATRLYSGVVVQKLLGTTYVSLLFDAGAAQQVAVKELDAYRIVDAKYDRGVLMVIGEHKGRYDRLIFRFDSGNYDVRVVPGIAPAGLNFVTLDSGVCICLNEDEKLEMFRATRGTTAIKYVEDATLSGDMRLAKMGGTLLFHRNGRVYKMRMK